MSELILGPLTTTFTPAWSCSIIFVSCSNCNNGWQAQKCVGGSTVSNDGGCWPGSVTNPFASGVYSPGTICPNGYTTACSHDAGKNTKDFDFMFPPTGSEVAIGCCPSHLGYLTLPHPGSPDIVESFKAFAPLFQLKYQPSDLPSTTKESITTSSNDGAVASTSSPQTSAAHQQVQHLSSGAWAGIGCGIALGIILLGTTVFFLIRSKRRNRAAASNVSTFNQDETKSTAELQVPHRVMEMTTDREIMELGTSH
ncbi:hypothetical protein M426DRAFT_262105 [Hypoxylon sp. CI-4A]|nr:hypothetical protein M426DRAFT_262105 [Hypoxylon sp. CI-4A]